MYFNFSISNLSSWTSFMSVQNLISTDRETQSFFMRFDR